MNVFNKVTVQMLKKNRVRTIVTIIGIMLSAAMICAVTTFVSSMYNYILENAIYNYGDWHGSALDAEWGTYEDIRTSGKVSAAEYGHQLGYAIAEGCENENKPYLYVLGASEGFEEMMPIHITVGRYPASGEEILLPNHLGENGNAWHKIGDVLTLGLGERVINGYRLSQNNPYDYPEGAKEIETLQVRETRTYTVVGFYNRPSFEGYTAPGYTAITLADVSHFDTGRFDIYFKMEDAEELYAFTDEYEISGSRNTNVLTYSGISRFSTYKQVLTGLAAIVIGLIMFGSVSLIYNAFSISVSERTKQFGLLTSIGATKKQLRKMVLFEALAVSAVGIPLGVLAGITGIGITLLLIGHKFESIMGYPIPMRISVSPESVMIAIVIALITVLISAWVPSKRATKVSAVEAIRQTQDFNIRERRGTGTQTASGLLYKLFGLPGILANKYYKRSRRKYRATIVSLFMSIVLFVSASAFTDYLMETVSGGFSSSGYDLAYFGDEEELGDMTKEQLLEMLKGCDKITDGAYTQQYFFNGETDRSNLSKQALEYLNYLGLQPENADGDTSASLNFLLLFLNDGEYGKLLDKYGLDPQSYLNPQEPLAIVADGTTQFIYEEERYVTFDVLAADTFEITLEDTSGEGSAEGGTAEKESAEKETVLRAGKVIFEDFFYFDNFSRLIFIYPVSLREEVLPEVYINNPTYKYYLISDDHSASYDAIRRFLSENGLRGSNLIDYAEREEEDRNIVTIIQVLSYGFIVLISLIAAANVFNTISTNINLRRREFAMLKSVGMSAKGLNKMMNFECLLYGSRALLYGLPVSVGVTYLIYRVVSAGYAGGFRLPWPAIGVAVLSVFAVVFSTMMYSMSKIKKDNPIDALKNENL